MKKINLLIPALVGLSATPFIGLTSCKVDVGGGGGDTPEPEPEPIPENVIVLNQFSGDVYDCSITTKTKQTYVKNTKYWFAIEFQHETEMETGTVFYRFDPWNNAGELPGANQRFLEQDTAIYINNTKNELDINQDFWVDEEEGSIGLKYEESQRVKDINEGDTIYIATIVNNDEGLQDVGFGFYASKP